MSFTIAELDEVVAEQDKWGDSGWPLFKWQEIDDVPTRLGTIKYVDDFGGEGEGDDYWVVVKVVGHDGTERYFKRLGWYQSYSGGELDGPTIEVRPREKMVTVYE